MTGLADRTVDLLKALANPVRIRILALCLERERSSRELREILGLSKPLLIAHIRRLVGLGLLEARAELDAERMIVRKYYRARITKVCVDRELLGKIAEEILGGGKRAR